MGKGREEAAQRSACVFSESTRKWTQGAGQPARGALVCNSRRGAKAASARALAAVRRAVAAGGEEKMGHCPSDQSI